MSYSSIAKDSLIKKKLRNTEEYLAVFLASTSCIGTITLSRSHGMGIKYTTESHQFAKLLSKCASSSYNVDAELTVHDIITGKTARTTVLSLFGKDIEKILTDSGLLSSEKSKFRTFDFCTKKIYLRGAFLSCGSITDPYKSYHLELVCRNESACQRIIDYASIYNVEMKYSKRKDNHVLYIKDSECISNFMTSIGADDAVLELESVKAYRDKINYVTRIYNCDIANITKTQNAATKQIEQITYLLSSPNVNLSTQLYDTAKARLNNPEATLSELADILGIGKSGVNHRLQRLIEIANNLRDGDE